MSDPLRPQKPEESLAEPGSRGPNLVLIYSLMALALLAAIAVAALVVLPFYNRR
ncbi:MAG TPA: hypothetical protein VGG85_17425 [Terracidiphilus sp.]|jgi:hypothetical protein